MIPVFEPLITDADIQAVVEALKRGEISGTFGDSIPQFEKEFSSFIGCEYGIAVNSGTSALHLAVLAAGIKPGDEVLLSTSTNIATALAVIHAGATPIPVDSEFETWNINLDLIEGLVSEKTQAILPVHLYGHPVDMDRLMEIAERYSLTVIEDCAESHGATCRGRMTGSFGDMGCFSFYANKVITSGEGGMIVTNNEEYASKLRSLRNLAFTTPRFIHYEAGFNFRITGFQAALGRSQFRRIFEILQKKRKIAQTYYRFLAGIPGLRLPVELDWAVNVYWMYGIVLLPDAKVTRDELIGLLQGDGIDTRTFFCPMNQQPVLRNMHGFKEIECPVADRLWRDGLYLPSSLTLTEQNIIHIAETIRKVFASREG